MYNEMATLAERIGIPSLSLGSIGAIVGAEKILESAWWQLTVQSVGVLAGLTAFIWGVIRIIDWRRKNKK
jgi:hypothetical protein